MCEEQQQQHFYETRCATGGLNKTPDKTPRHALDYYILPVCEPRVHAPSMKRAENVWVINRRGKEENSQAALGRAQSLTILTYHMQGCLYLFRIFQRYRASAR